MIVKTWEDERLISDLVETFDNLRIFKMKLHPENYKRKVTQVYGLLSWY
jgi:hypothetical protein